MPHCAFSGIGGVCSKISTIGYRTCRRAAINMRGIKGKWKAMWHSSPDPEIGHHVGRPLVRLGQQHDVFVGFLYLAPRTRRRNSWLSGRFSQIVPSRSKR